MARAHPAAKPKGAAPAVAPPPATTSTAPSVPDAGNRRKALSTVTVACKIPNGLELQLYVPADYDEETPSGTRKRKRFVPDGNPPVVVRGPAVPNGQRPAGYVVPQRIAGYALTPGVPADFWDAWLAQNQKAPYVMGKLIWADSRQEVLEFAREHAKTRSGLEPMAMDPSKDPRTPKPINAAVSKVETSDDMGSRPKLPPSAEDEVERD